jgi:hypothetical protein
MVANILIKRTSVADQAPAANSLQPGELAVEMASTPPKLWVGVPAGIDATGQRLRGARRSPRDAGNGDAEERLHRRAGGNTGIASPRTTRGN